MADLDARQLADGQFFGRIVKQHAAETVAGILSADEVG